PPTPSPLFERGLNMYLIRAETAVISSSLILLNIFSLIDFSVPKTISKNSLGLLCASSHSKSLNSRWAIFSINGLFWRNIISIIVTHSYDK
ncbi:MAG: hypothetical protein ACKPGQ_07155, partial [Dolichospermum sp.]